MKRPLVVLMALVASMLQLPIAHAFWSYYNYQEHQDITKGALSPPVTYCFSKGNCFTFSSDAIKAINSAHAFVDDPKNYDFRIHFDSNSFTASLKQMALERGQLNQILSNSAPGLDVNSVAAQQKVWQLLGFMLHAAEDFYAHSTWVDAGISGIIDGGLGFGALTENTTMPNTGLFMPLPTGTYCGPDGYPLQTMPINYLITGYYTPGTLVPQVAPPGGCIHGDTIAFGSLCVDLGKDGPPPTLTVPGISHDIACGGNFYPANTTALHDSASQDAMLEAISLVQAIVADLVASNNATGFCTLLGLGSNTPMCAANVTSIPSGSTVTLSLMDLIGTDADGARVGGPGSASAGCTAPCGFTAAGASAFDSTASVSDMWIQHGTTTVINFTSSLHGVVAFTPGANAQMTASAQWVTSPGAFQGGFGGTLLLIVADDYTATVTCNSSYADNVGDTSSPTDCTQVTLQVSFSKADGSSVTATNMSGTLSFVLPSGQYFLNWSLIGGTGTACCLGTQGLTGTSTWNKGMTITFQPTS
jgi:hypothetical protein